MALILTELPTHSFLGKETLNCAAKNCEFTSEYFIECVLLQMDVASPHITSAAKLRPSPSVPGSMEAAIKMWLQVGNVQKLQQVPGRQTFFSRFQPFC